MLLLQRHISFSDAWSPVLNLGARGQSGRLQCLHGEVLAAVMCSHSRFSDIQRPAPLESFARRQPHRELIVHEDLTMQPEIGVLIVGHEPIVRTGLGLLLSQDPSIWVVGEAADYEQALKMIDERKPTILVFDSPLTESRYLDTLAEFEKCKNIRIIVVLDEPSKSDKTAAAKPAAVVSKDSSVLTLIKTIHRVASGGLSTETLRPGESREANALTRLGVREKEVARLICQGFQRKAIAKKMSISLCTVKGHVTKIFDKLGISDRLELLLYAIRNNTSYEIGTRGEDKIPMLRMPRGKNDSSGATEPRVRSRMSVDARRRIAEAQRRRWTAQKGNARTAFTSAATECEKLPAADISGTVVAQRNWLTALEVNQKKVA
jgi:DNA-binding NarL/FixJ family response regulator